MTILSPLTVLCVTNLHARGKTWDTGKPDVHKISFDSDILLLKNTEEENGEVRTSDNLFLHKSNKNTGKNC